MMVSDKDDTSDDRQQGKVGNQRRSLVESIEQLLYDD